ncbi:ABC transporter ATP-binding protein [Pseudonocardia thermophila]|uniref:ABC transporter ATP-binding protein n=1 Tax=Pseudonocardia thermophila TaxID=1848 RepID=UPI001F3E8A8F|nr:ABC transporter ATP-binding protein [Pseudonocardia thermophila]
MELDVSAGEFVAVIGANGAGKSTLLNTIAGLLPPWEGQITVDGEDVTGEDSADMVRRGVVLVPEGRQIFGRMTVAENLRLGAYSPRCRADAEASERRVYELFPRLAERRDQLAATMSGGEQQMLALGRSLMAQPRLLLLDEPSLGLAPVAVDVIFAALAELRGDLTVVLVEQDASRALEFCDRGFVMEQGGFTLTGEARALLGDSRLMSAYLGMEVGQ